MSPASDSTVQSEHSAVAPAGRGNPPLVAHLIYGWHCGGLEKILATIIARTPRERYRHAIICLTGVADAAFRIDKSQVLVFCLNKRPGNDPLAYIRLYRLLRELRPAILHTRNIGAIDGQFMGRLAGVPAAIHGVHGRDVYDLDGSRYLWLRKAMRPFIDRYIAVSRDLGRWLIEAARVPAQDLTQIYNGVDVELFRPRRPGEDPSTLLPSSAAGKVVIGTVERLQSVKDPLNLIRAFAQLVSAGPDIRDRVHLLLVGDGPLRESAEDLIRASGLAGLVTMAGRRDDIPELMRAMDIFVLPSLAEGTSNTILEAMASGLPVVATGVGGSPELVIKNVSGLLVPPRNPESLAAAILRYVLDAPLRDSHGKHGRQRVVSEFSLARMTESYLAAYDELLKQSRPHWTRRFLNAAIRNPAGQALKRGVLASARYTGMNQRRRRSARQRLTVLCYHAVVQAEHPDEAFVYRNAVSGDVFENQLSRIRRWFTPISLRALLAHLYHGEPLPEAPALITFDDGYRNNLLTAAPILKKLAVPALFFVTTGYIGSAINLWANEIDLRILSCPNAWIPAPDGAGAMFVPANIEARRDLAFHVRNHCKRLVPQELNRYLQTLEAAAPAIDRSRYAELFDFLSWDDVRQLSLLGFDIGSHTVTHSILSRLPGEDVMSELRDSKLRIERELGVHCNAIAYPNGSPDDYSVSTLKAAKEAGYLAGFSLRNGRDLGGNPFDIDRINVPGHLDEAVFDAVVSGSYETVRNLRGRAL